VIVAPLPISSEKSCRHPFADEIIGTSSPRASPPAWPSRRSPYVSSLSAPQEISTWVRILAVPNQHHLNTLTIDFLLQLPPGPPDASRFAVIQTCLAHTGASTSAQIVPWYFAGGHRQNWLACLSAPLPPVPNPPAGSPDGTQSFSSPFNAGWKSLNFTSPTSTVAAPKRLTNAQRRASMSPTSGMPKRARPSPCRFSGSRGT